MGAEGEGMQVLTPQQASAKAPLDFESACFSVLCQHALSLVKGPRRGSGGGGIWSVGTRSRVTGRVLSLSPSRLLLCPPPVSGSLPFL